MCRVSVDPRIVMLALVGLVLIATAGLERLIKRLPLWTPVSLPMIYVGLGWAAFAAPLGLPVLDPASNAGQATTTEYLTEFIVIVSLMTAGLAIDRPLRWRGDGGRPGGHGRNAGGGRGGRGGWGGVWPLLAVTMPLTILAVSLAGWGWLGLAPAAAILLGAAVSPTDPVLASAVQVGAPGVSEAAEEDDQGKHDQAQDHEDGTGGTGDGDGVQHRHDVRFALTVEAGFNDGLAFPFTYLAIAAVGATGLGAWTLQWLAMDVAWRVLAGIGVGVLAGRATSWYVFGRDSKAGDHDEDDTHGTEGEHDLVQQRSEGIVAIGAILASYGLAEIIGGYGFLAVFIAAVTLRQTELAGGAPHAMMHRFVEQIEQIIMVLMLLGFGGLLASGVLAELTWPGALLGLAVVLVLRPLAGLIALVRCSLPISGRAMIAFAGVRGIGSIYYLAYGQNQGDFGDLSAVWSVVAWLVLVSLVLHGASARALMHLVERRGGHRPAET